MNLNPTKKAILEKLSQNGQPMKPLEVAKQLGISRPQAMMHLLGLKQMGYVSSPERNTYVITELGRDILGLPKLAKTQASKILQPMPPEKAFHFFIGIGHSLGICANSLQDFCDKVQKVKLQSIEFHVLRKDFENWLQHIGDEELAKKLATIREEGASGEELRKRVYEATKHRCEELRKQTSV
jgi:DNA-binding transcriptional ArsR family regulator